MIPSHDTPVSHIIPSHDTPVSHMIPSHDTPASHMIPCLTSQDEPTSGVDPRARRFLWSIIRGLVGAGQSVLLTTHRYISSILSGAVNVAQYTSSILRGQSMLLSIPVVY